jgi:hypothetical protein
LRFKNNKKGRGNSLFPRPDNRFGTLNQGRGRRYSKKSST